MLINKFFKLDKSYKKMKDSAKKIVSLTTEDISLISGPISQYYESRAKDGFTFDDQLNVEETNNDFLVVQESESSYENS